MLFLSEEWLSAANAAVQATEGAPQDPLVIDQHITGARSYRIVLGPRPSVERIDPTDATRPPADGSFTQSIATARSIATGETDAHQAYLLGQIRFEGDVNALIERRDAFEWLERALAPAMAQTTFEQ